MYVVVIATLLFAMFAMTRFTSLRGFFMKQNTATIQAVRQRQGTEFTSNPSSPDCGKICSYDFDHAEPGKLYPLLHKTVNCSNIMYRMAHPPYRVIYPPPRRPPAELLRDFQQNGQCPIVYTKYRNDAKATKSTAPGSRDISASIMMRYIARDRAGENVNTYRDKNIVKPTLMKYVDKIRDKHVAVIGTLRPWAEAIILNIGADKITTIEYNTFKIDHDRIHMVTPYKIAESFVNGTMEFIDSAFSYSSIEHSGLGRYGDPVTPFGDLEAVAQVWCMLKPGGFYFLAVPVSNSRRRCTVNWNEHRVYGDVRLQHLTANYRVHGEYASGDVNTQSVFVLEKISSL